MIVYTLITEYTDRTNKTSLESVKTFKTESLAKISARSMSANDLVWEYDGEIIGRNSRGFGLNSRRWTASNRRLSFTLYESKVE